MDSMRSPISSIRHYFLQIQPMRQTYATFKPFVCGGPGMSHDLPFVRRKMARVSFHWRGQAELDSGGGWGRTVKPSLYVRHVALEFHYVICFYTSQSMIHHNKCQTQQKAENRHR